MACHQTLSGSYLSAQEVGVGVTVEVLVDVGVGVEVEVGVKVGVAVDVLVAVGVAVAVLVGISLSIEGGEGSTLIAMGFADALTDWDTYTVRDAMSMNPNRMQTLFMETV